MQQGSTAAICRSMVGHQFIEGSYAMVEIQWEGSEGFSSYSKLHLPSLCLLLLALASR
jgi:hypothetical protein